VCGGGGSGGGGDDVCAWVDVCVLCDVLCVCVCVWWVGGWVGGSAQAHSRRGSGRWVWGLWTGVHADMPMQELARE
jgi:hypothetical protein